MFVRMNVRMRSAPDTSMWGAMSTITRARPHGASAVRPRASSDDVPPSDAPMSAGRPSVRHTSMRSLEKASTL
jgi:hypothetical protein